MSTNTVKEGDIVLTSTLFTHVILDGYKQQVCDYCLHLGINDVTLMSPIPLQRCSNCQEVYYCNQKCQKAAWHIHRQECKIINGVKSGTITGKYANNFVRLLVRTLIKLRKGGNEEYEVMPDGTHRRFSDLTCHEREIKNCVEMNTFLNLAISLAKQFLGVESQDIKHVEKVFCRIVTNTTPIVDGFLMPYATGIYLGLSKIDHSCRPNVNAKFVGREVHLAAMHSLPEPVLHNIRITYDYTPFLSRAERRSYLKSKYFFDCTCDLCEEEKDIDPSPTMPCMTCKIQVKVDPDTARSSKCSSCHKPVEKNKVLRYGKWRLTLKDLMTKLETPDQIDNNFGLDVFSAYREGVDLKVANDMFLVHSAHMLQWFWCNREQGDVTKTMIEEEEVAQVVKTVRDHMQAIHHRNSFQVANNNDSAGSALQWMGALGGGAKKYKKLYKEANRVYSLYYSNDEPFFQSILLRRKWETNHYQPCCLAEEMFVDLMKSFRVKM